MRLFCVVCVQPHAANKQKITPETLHSLYKNIETLMCNNICSCILTLTFLYSYSYTVRKVLCRFRCMLLILQSSTVCDEKFSQIEGNGWNLRDSVTVKACTHGWQSSSWLLVSILQFPLQLNPQSFQCDEMLLRVKFLLMVWESFR